jgi:hypothetical protein
MAWKRIERIEPDGFALPCLAQTMAWFLPLH